jgi:uncharacterized protein YjbI with pentapeptide repeats
MSRESEADVICQGGILVGANLNSANLTRADLTGANLRGRSGDPRVHLTSSLTVHDAPIHATEGARGGAPNFGG